MKLQGSLAKKNESHVCLTEVPGSAIRGPGMTVQIAESAVGFTVIPARFTVIPAQAGISMLHREAKNVSCRYQQLYGQILRLHRAEKAVSRLPLRDRT